MWESIKNLITAAKDLTGIELPELPVDLGAAGEMVTGSAQQLGESAAGVVDGAAVAGETLTGDLTGALAGDLAGAAETVAGLPVAAAESVGQVLPDLTNLTPDAARR
jgi:hypothetical protein